MFRLYINSLGQRNHSLAGSEVIADGNLEISDSGDKPAGVLRLTFESGRCSQGTEAGDAGNTSCCHAVVSHSQTGMYWLQLSLSLNSPVH